MSGIKINGNVIKEEQLDVLEEGFADVQKDALSENLIRMLCEKNITLSTAESCTGGLLSSRITKISGCSKVFKGGVCTYSNQSKMKLLSVSERTLREFGAVSAQTASEMAVGIRRIMDSDIGISITGIAGPNSDNTNKPVGLVHIGIADETNVCTYRLNIDGARNYVQYITSSLALRFAITTCENMCN